MLLLKRDYCTYLNCPHSWISVVFKAEFSGLTEMRIFESSIPASHLKTDFLCIVGIWIYREGTLKRKPFSRSPVLRYKGLVASKRLLWETESCYKIRN